jgi:tetratricopeptide (TPR) repeat protein
MLWLQIIVRGFWHASGHLGDYYLAHGQPERAVALQAHALATARYLDAPAAAAGLAGYSLACAQARAGRLDQAARTLAEAIEANPDLRANAGRNPDLAGVRTEL